jgi:hypothetical protein
MDITVKGLRCPKCKSGEMHPNGKWLLIRGFKVQDANGHWASQCLVCAGYYDDKLNVIDEQARPEGGWF